MPDTSQIPPQILAALQQQQQAGASGVDVGDMLQQLMQMSPDEVASVLQQMGIQVSPEQVHSAAENWVDQAADDVSGSSPDDETTEATPDSETAEGESNPPSSAANLEGAEAAAGEQPADDAAEGDEGDNSQLPPNAQPTSQRGSSRAAAVAEPTAVGADAMPSGVRGGASAPNTIDDLISAQMMQRATGNPNALVPSGRGAVPMPRSASALPTPRPSGAASDPRMKAMIADIYRGGSKTGKQRAPSAAIPRGRPR